MKRLISFFVLTLLLLDLQEVLSEDCSMTNPCEDLGAGTELYQKPDQVWSENSDWSTTLTVDIGTITYNWLELKRRLYNGKAVGPTIKVKRGDEFQLTLINNLSPAGNDEKELNEMQLPNTTNIHTHGLHISSEPGQDDVLLKIEPGETFVYEYKIHQNSEPGTYWYHAHVHGSTSLQVVGGLAGLIIVDDVEESMPDELAAASCPGNCDKDIQLLFQSALKFGGFGDYDYLQNNTGDYDGFKNDHYEVEGYYSLSDWLVQNVKYYTTNGQLQPRLIMNASQVYRFRMANSDAVSVLSLHITDDTGNPTTNCAIREIAMDAIYLSEPMEQISGRTELIPGGRVDWLVRCNSVGHYKVQSDTGGELMNLVNLHVRPWHSSVPQQEFPSTLPQHIFLENLLDIAEEDIKGHYEIKVGPSRMLNDEHWQDGDHIRYTMKLNEIQEWQIVSYEDSASHPIHIHVNHFQIISYNENTATLDKNKLSSYRKDKSTYSGVTMNLKADQSSLSRTGIFRDTIYITPGTNLTMRFRPIDFTGKVITHCHILPHEDTGMMMVLEIED